MTPRAVFHRVATAEAVTWALLLLGMVLKYGTRTTELGVRVFGLVHGVVFVGYCLTAVFVAVNQRWGALRTLLALAAAVPPFATVWFDRWAQRRGLLADGWRLVPGGDRPSSPAERLQAWALARPALAVALGAVAVVSFTGVALVVGPPVPTRG